MSKDTMFKDTIYCNIILNRMNSRHILMLQNKTLNRENQPINLYSCGRCTYNYNLNTMLVCPMCNTNFMSVIENMYEDSSDYESSDSESSDSESSEDSNNYTLFYIDGVINDNRNIKFLINTSILYSTIPLNLYNDLKISNKNIKVTFNKNYSLICRFKMEGTIPTLGIDILSKLGIRIDCKNNKLIFTE
jgi:hypothetical protein